MNRIAIICVDDDELILDSLRRQLKYHLDKNYDIELASSGSEALQLCAELTADGVSIALVISDQQMPEMSGDEFLIELHNVYPKILKILLTGQAEAESVGNIVNAAALYRYVAKPWNETDLILTVKEALRRYGQEKQLAQKNRLLQQTNQKLAKSLNILLATLEAADDGILVLDSQGNIVVFNQQFLNLWQINSQLTEQDTNHLLSLILCRLAHPFACDLKANKGQNAVSKYHFLKLHNGNILESYFKVQELETEDVGLVWGFRDVTAREQEKAIANHRATHDTITQLPRRSILTHQLTQAIAQAQKNSHALAVMFVDLERLKAINESFGHQIGDRLLQQVVQRLKNCIREEDIIARWGSGEFTLLLPKIHRKEEANAIAERILNVLKFPFIIENQSIYITIGIGIAAYPEHGADAETLLKNADAALAQSQRLNKHNYQYYNPALHSQAHELLTIENLLHSALKKEEFILYYQPIVNVSTGKIEKMEALIRWQSPQLGLVSPSVFIPLAEKNGLIIPIGQWVLQTACSQNKAWQNMGLAPVQMSVNLSVNQFQQENLVSTVADILKETQLSPSYLELEVTESSTMENTQLAQIILKELNDMGICLSMDDFGTGYSSLSYLKQFPFHTLKIDRSLVKDLDCSSQDIAIVKAAITLGKGLNLKIVAEGVETSQLRDLLKSLGCEYIQGYLYSKPLPGEEATKLLKRDYFV